MANDFSANDVVALTRKLVSIPGVNPVLADRDVAIAGEHRMAEFLDAYLTQRGFDCQRFEKTHGRPNIMATYPCATKRRRLIIEAHLDTQGIHGMTVPPFEGRLADGRIYGRGACDMKGPMAAALVNFTDERLRRLSQAGVELVFIGAIGEETGNIGALEFVESGFAAEEILVLEPTDLHVVHAHKGAFWFEIDIKGLAAHGSNPEKGVNAISAAGPVIDAVQKQVAGSRFHSALLGRPTANIGTIRGGSSVNIVPDQCIIQVDRRTVPGEHSARILEELRTSLDRIVADGVMRGYELRMIKEGVPFETSAETNLVRRLCRACDALGVAIP